MAIPGGTWPLVGISGLTQGGGIGPFSGEYGLTLELLVGAHIVTVDGKHRYVNASEDRDIFWAIRGGDGGNFGVVTAFDFVRVPVDMAGCTAGQRAYESRPITSNRAASAQPTARVRLWYRGSRTRADQAIKEFISAVGATPTSQTEVKQTFFEAEYDEYCAGSKMPTSSTRSLTPY